MRFPTTVSAVRSSHTTGAVKVLCLCVALAGTAMPAISEDSGKAAANTTPAQIFEDMRKSFRADKAKGVHVRYQFKFSGPTGGNWWIIVTDGTFKMGTGIVDSPDVTFIASDKDWVALTNGTLGGVRAFLTGRLSVNGDKSLARKLDEIFP